jgi:tetratricopeptide (TPR) repeat protein
LFLRAAARSSSIAELDVPDVIDLLGAEPADERTSTAETRISVSSSTASSRAEAAAEKALSINPQLSGAQSSLALQQVMRDGDIVRATENAMKAVAANPNDVRARSRYAQILAGSGQLDRALIELDTAMARDPFSARLATQMGELHFAMGHPDEAMYALHRALDLDSTNVGARITLALVLNQRGETEEALEEIERAAAITPDHAAVQSTHGYLLGQAGRTDEARAVARQLEERARSGRIPGNLVAQVWSAVGDATRAAQWLDRVESSGRRGGEGRGEGHSTRIFVSPTVRYMFSEMRDLPELRSKLDSMGFPVMVVTTDSLRIIPRPPPPTDSLRRRR